MMWLWERLLGCVGGGQEWGRPAGHGNGGSGVLTDGACGVWRAGRKKRYLRKSAVQLPKVSTLVADIARLYIQNEANMRRSVLLFALLLVLLSLSACTEQKSPAVQAVEAYQMAFASKDADELAQLSCAAWEAQALLEMDSFQAVGTQLEAVACTEAGTTGDAVLVTCEGSINLTYGDEKRSFDLAGRTYTVVEEGSNWLVCGAQP